MCNRILLFPTRAGQPGRFSRMYDLLLNNLLEFYKKNDNMDRMIKIINGESRTSLRIIDWFSTNYANVGGRIITAATICKGSIRIYLQDSTCEHGVAF